MQLAKTERAREALSSGKTGAVDLRERRVLILADGKRTRADLVAMLGADCMASIDRLVREGYLASPTSIVAPAPVAAPTTPPPPPGKRRSLAAAKMYLIDMLQLQRTPTAAEWRLALQSTSDPVVLLDRLVDALAYLVASSPASYGERVSARFAEVVPEEALSRLPAVAA